MSFSTRRFFMLCRVFFAFMLGISYLLLPGNGLAEPAIGLGGAVITSPYKGYSADWSPTPLLRYEKDSFYIRGVRAGYKMLDLENLELSGFFEYNPMHFDHDDTTNKKLKRLNTRDSSLMSGLAARIITPMGTFHASASLDLTTGSHGVAGDLGYVYTHQVGNVTFLPTVGVKWHSSDYNRYYYGISSGDRRSSGLEKYSPDSSVSPYVGLTMNVSLGERWEAFCSMQSSFLGSAIRNSPMVDTMHTETFAVGLSYDF